MNYMALMGAGVALMVGAFLIYTTMTMAITQRRPVISMLRAIGGRRVTIVRDMLAEAAILGIDRRCDRVRYRNHSWAAWLLVDCPRR